MTRRVKTNYIVFHCTATRPDLDIGAGAIREWHLAKGWADIGYHLVIRRDGRIEPGRPLDAIGAHVAGHNSDSIGIALVGGLDAAGTAYVHRPDLFTDEQWTSARVVTAMLRRMYPSAQLLGHRDLSPDKNHDGKITPDEYLKLCPCFNAHEMLGGFTA